MLFVYNNFRKFIKKYAASKSILSTIINFNLVYTFFFFKLSPFRIVTPELKERD